MANPKILNDNINYLDENPAALRNIAKETLELNIQTANKNNNDALSKALQKAYEYKKT